MLVLCPYLHHILYHMAVKYPFMPQSKTFFLVRPRKTAKMWTKDIFFTMISGHLQIVLLFVYKAPQPFRPLRR